MAMKKIIIAGCGPGGLDQVTPAVRAAVARAQVLVGAPRLLAAFPRAPGRRIVVSADIGAVLRQMATQGRAKRTVVLVTGDPGLFSLAKAVIRRFGRRACEVLPGISSVQTAFARIGLDWQDARILSAHERIPTLKPAALHRERKIAILAGGEKSRAWLAALAEGLGKAYQIFVCENLTLPGERIRRVTTTSLRRVPLPSRTIVLYIHKEVLL